MTNPWKELIIVVEGAQTFANFCSFSVDFYRAQNGKSPVFCIHYSTLKDGGTKEYIGFGYKVIAYHKTNGYKNIHVGTFFMQYDDQLGGKLTLEPVNTYDSTSDGTNTLPY